MKNYIKIIIVIITGIILISEYSFSQTDEKIKIESISGVLIKVDKTKLIILIKINSRFVRFHATPKICAEFKKNINSKVNVTFTSKNGKSLQLVTIEVIPEMDSHPLKPEGINKK
ncbi:MAG TPA: hypothetical protein PKG60_08100 [Spirochaetota bacterium]|nr:hypothetical protein [Spirochaetota bacterium]HPS88284.1 hypothetical protein [Spirochaetota bacterium]